MNLKKSLQLNFLFRINTVIWIELNYAFDFAINSNVFIFKETWMEGLLHTTIRKGFKVFAKTRSDEYLVGDSVNHLFKTAYHLFIQSEQHHFASSSNLKHN